MVWQKEKLGTGITDDHGISGMLCHWNGLVYGGIRREFRRHRRRNGIGNVCDSLHHPDLIKIAFAFVLSKRVASIIRM